uniref:Glutathione peroxidase n=1 Tax=Monopterus albus TaxID=43700 RepID=A0A3Q3Q7F6_MONAL
HGNRLRGLTTASGLLCWLLARSNKDNQLSFVCVCLYQRCDFSTDGTIYKYQAKTLNGNHTVNFSNYRGKIVLFVNVATY